MYLNTTLCNVLRQHQKPCFFILTISSFHCSVRELSSFVQDTTLGLSDKVEDGDYAGLVTIMGHLMAIRDRQISNEKHFKPLKSTVELLKTYGQQLPECIYTQLEVCINVLMPVL